ncbi:MAG: adenylate/guanylate cyclase domain-containing protein [Acidimicrobiales bacterium]
MSLTGEAREAGANALASLRVQVSERLASMLQKDDELVATAVEMGLVDRDWLEEPGRHPIRTTSTRDVIKRFVERSAERHPSMLAQLGVTALQILSWTAEDAPDGIPAPLAVVFTDLEGFTKFTARAGDEAAREVLARHHKLVGPVVRSRGGRLVKRLGDGLLVTFPEAEAAVYCALELIDTAPEPLRLRAGVHFGDAVATLDDVIGHSVNVAARVTEVAKGGEVLVTGDVVARVGELRGVRFARCRRRSFKGVGESVRVCRAESEAVAAVG